MWLPLVGLLIGIIIGSVFSLQIPAQYSRYTAMAILAAFDSVGTWIARTHLRPGGMTMRAVVVCTWVGMDGAQTSQRRYAVVTMAPKADGMEVLEAAVFAGRD